MKKRILSFLLVVMMLVTMLPMTAFATENEMSDEFKALLNEKGQFEMNSVIPTTEREEFLILQQYILAITDYCVEIEVAGTYEEDVFKRNILLNTDEIFEMHEVEIVFNYDENIKKDVDALVKTFPQEETFFYVRDMELINYWLSRTGDDKVDETGGGLDNFSSELKALLGNKNYKFYVDNRMGLDNIFLTERVGIAWILHDDVIYYGDDALGTKAEHIIYVPDETGDSPEELLAAVQKRVDDYLGKGKVTVKLGGDDLTKAMDFMDPILAELEEELAPYEAKRAELKAAWDAKTAIVNQYEAEISPIESRIYDLNAWISEEENNIKNAGVDETEYIADCQARIDEYKAEKAEKEAILAEKTPLREAARVEEQELCTEYYAYENEVYLPMREGYDRQAGLKDEYLEMYEDPESEISYIHNAAGGCWFEITCNGATYRFVVIKDSDKMLDPTYASSDVATNVSISSTDSSIPLDTRVDVDKITSGAEYDKIMNVLDVKDNVTFDISLYSDAKGGNVTKLDNGTFEVKIPVSDELKGKDLVAYYVDKENKIVEYEVTVKDGYAVFDTDHFSIYTIAEAPKTNAGGAGVAKPAPEVVAPENNAADSKIEEDAETVVEKIPFTEAEKAEIEAGAEVVITLEVKDITETVSAEDKAKVEAEVKEVKDQKIGMYLDVNMFKKVGDNAAVKVPELNGKVKIQLTVPDDLLAKDAKTNRIYSIIRIHDGETTVIAAKFDAETKTLEFETDCFSTYALVYKDAVDVPNTGDSSLVAVWMLLLVVGGCTVIYGVKRRNYI